MDKNPNDLNWKILYKIGAVAVLLTVLIMVAEIFLTMLPDGSRSNNGPGDIYSWFSLFDRNWFMAMRNLGLINIFATTLTIPVYFSLFGLHYKRNIVPAAMSLILFLVSYAIFMADNVAFPMLALSWKYSIADPESKQFLLGAGEALLAKGISHTPGTFPGFFLSELAAILISIVIFQSGILKKRVGVIGIMAFSLMLVFEVLSSFYIHLFSIAMVIAVFGGILALTWYVLLGISLYRASK